MRVLWFTNVPMPAVDRRSGRVTAGSGHWMSQLLDALRGVPGLELGVATAYPGAVAALRSAGDLKGKVIVDITNPLTADYMGLAIGHSTSAAEEIQSALPDAKVVKAFNTVFAQVIAAGPKLAGATVPVYLAGDDSAAKETVRSLVQSIGFASVDAGGLRNARYLEPLAGLNIYFGYGAGRGTALAPAWIGIQ